MLIGQLELLLLIIILARIQIQQIKQINKNYHLVRKKRDFCNY